MGDSYTKSDIGLGNVDNTRDIDKPNQLGARMRPFSTSPYPSSEITTLTWNNTTPYGSAWTTYAYAAGLSVNTPARFSMPGWAGTVYSGGTYAGVNNITGSSSDLTPYFVEFYTNAADFVLFFGAFAADFDWRVWANDMPLSDWQHSNPGNDGYGFNYLRIQFTGSKVRKITVAVPGAILFGGLIKPSADTTSVFWPAERRPMRVAVVGDSYITGGAGSPDPVYGGNIVTSTIAQQLSLLTGWEVLAMAEGGTGYMNPGGGSPREVYNSTSRNTALAALGALDAIIVWGTLNDFGYSTASLQAAATAYFSALATDRPTAPVIVVGPEVNPTYGVDATALAHDTALQTAANAAPNVRAYISQIQGTGTPWITGTVSGGSITNGNGQVFISGTDNLHPSRAGHEYLARRLTQALASVKV
ncbi:MAG: SGNH/GDSL hydrolase family protein [Nocardiaceae bacterium]|nr:SGNH/GDSL hydrolase family protein [Nocardiaceae bacterium]